MSYSVSDQIERLERLRDELLDPKYVANCIKIIDMQNKLLGLYQQYNNQKTKQLSLFELTPLEITKMALENVRKARANNPT